MTADGRGDKLLCVWTSGDRDVALRMVFMYVSNGKKNGWWDEVTLLVWGPSQKLLAEDDVLKGRLAEMLALGVRVVACRACADTYSLADTLEGLGVEVFYTGKFLSDWAQSEAPVLTF